MFAIVFVLAFLPVAPGGAGDVLLAQSGSDAMQRELERLRGKRQKAKDKAAEDRKIRRGSLRRSQKNPGAPKRIHLTLPPGWQNAGKSSRAGAGGRLVFGDTRVLSKARSEVIVYTLDSGQPNQPPERIAVERFKKSKSVTLDLLYRTWREKILAGCAQGRETGPKDSVEDGVAVIESYYVCFRSKTDDSVQIFMLKAVDGAAELFAAGRQWQAPPAGTGFAPDLVAIIGDWKSWAKSATAAPAVPAQGEFNKKAADKGSPEKTSHGYGFVVSSAGHIVTTHSLTKDCRSLSFSKLPAALTGTDQDKNLALFKLRSKPKAMMVFRWGGEAVRGDSVALPSFSSKKGLTADLSVSTGIISALVGPGGDPRLLSVTVPIPPGNSGLPLVDLTGTVAGMALAGPEVSIITASPPGAFPETNFALSAKTLRSFLESQEVKYEAAKVGKIVSPGQAAWRARAATVEVECRN